MSCQKIVAIASSTGGPKALQAVIPKLPGNLNVPVVIVQHMPAGFTASLAERLDCLSRLTVEEAAEGTVLENNHVYIAKGGKHLTVKPKGKEMVLEFLDEPVREGVKPCANYLFESLANSSYEEIVCVVMTGMGADGAEGIANLKKSKRVTVITQDELSCAVYGMPKSVVKAGLSDITASLDKLADVIVKTV